MRNQHRPAAATLFLSGIYCCFLSGCQDQGEIHVVEVPVQISERRGASPVLPAPAASLPEESGTAVPPESSSLTFVTPDGWKAKPNGAMRQASFDVIDGDVKCDVSVIRLGPGQPVLDNVNRWRGQIKLPPVAENELALKEISCRGKPGSLVELTGETESILAVMVARPDATWFLKLQGPNALAQRERDRFTAFAESFEIP